MTTPISTISADRVWDGITDTALIDAVITIDDERIVSLGPANQRSTTTAGQHFDGCTILPGLIDAHVHYCGWMGPLFLAAGVTTVRDVGNGLEWILDRRSRHTKDPSLGPRIVCCGCANDGQGGLWHRLARQHTDAASLRQSVREHHTAGVDQIKFYANLNLDWLAEGLEEARSLGITTVSHLGAIDAGDALRAGLNQIEHLSGCAPAWSDNPDPDFQQLINTFLEHAGVIDPTLVIWDRLGRIYELAFRNDRRRDRLPVELVSLWDRFARGYLSPVGSHKTRYVSKMPQLKRFLVAALRAGVTCGLGTDTPFPHLIPGTAVHDELAQYIDAGLTPVEALRCATSTNARVIGQEDCVGRIAPGHDADLLVVRGDPTRDIRDIQKIVAVVHRGRLFEPAELLTRTDAHAFDADEPVMHDLINYVEKIDPQPSRPSVQNGAG